MYKLYAVVVCTRYEQVVCTRYGHKFFVVAIREYGSTL